MYDPGPLQKSSRLKWTLEPFLNQFILFHCLSCHTHISFIHLLFSSLPPYLSVLDLHVAALVPWPRAA